MALDVFLDSPVFRAAELAVLLGDPNDPAPVLPKTAQRIVLIVGPEGGFSEAERSSLAGKARSWFLGGRILRAETAVVVGLTAVQMIWGDFRS
jgi:16S rRNA (uracil1498-N3)-methyltransferase